MVREQGMAEARDEGKLGEDNGTGHSVGWSRRLPCSYTI